MSASLTGLSNTCLIAAPQAQRAGWGAVLAALLSRTALFALIQLFVAGLLWAAGSGAPWAESAAWWPLVAALANLASLALLAVLLRREGGSLRDLYRFERATIKRDLLLTLGLLVLSAPLAYLPNIGLGALLFGNPEVPFGMMFRPLPLWAALASLALFPLTVAFAELPTYYGYALPRLAELTGRGWLALLLAAGWHAAQHIALPLIFDWRFALWRLGMFVPFALLIGFALWRRPRLLPYLMIVHGLLDAQAVIMLLSMGQS